MKQFAIFILSAMFLISCTSQTKQQNTESKEELLKQHARIGDTIRIITNDNRDVTIKVKDITANEVIGESNTISLSNIYKYTVVKQNQPEGDVLRSDWWWYLGFRKYYGL